MAASRLEKKGVRVWVGRKFRSQTSNIWSFNYLKSCIISPQSKSWNLRSNTSELISRFIPKELKACMRWTGTLRGWGGEECGVEMHYPFCCKASATWFYLSQSDTIEIQKTGSKLNLNLNDIERHFWILWISNRMRFESLRTPIARMTIHFEALIRTADPLPAQSCEALYELWTHWIEHDKMNFEF